MSLMRISCSIFPIGSTFSSIQQQWRMQMEQSLHDQICNGDTLQLKKGFSSAVVPPSSDFICDLFLMYARSNIRKYLERFKMQTARHMSLDHTFYVRYNQVSVFDGKKCYCPSELGHSFHGFGVQKLISLHMQLSK